MLEEVRVDLALVEGRVGLDVVLVLLDLNLEAGFLGQIVLNVVENLGVGNGRRPHRYRDGSVGVLLRSLERRFVVGAAGGERKRGNGGESDERLETRHGFP